MRMLQPPIDADVGAATNGGRRPTVVAAPASATRIISPAEGSVQKLVESRGDCDSCYWTSNGCEPVTEAGTKRACPATIILSGHHPDCRAAPATLCDGKEGIRRKRTSRWSVFTRVQVPHPNRWRDGCRRRDCPCGVFGRCCNCISGRRQALG